MFKAENFSDHPRKMKEYAALVERYERGKSKVLGAKHVPVPFRPQ
jgi:hypothetical protein